MKPLNKINLAWTPPVAYAVGLLVADGCLSKDGRHMDFTSKDKNLVITFKRCLGLRCKIDRKASGYTKELKYYRVQFSEVTFYRWLLVIGLTPRKSKTIGALRIPHEYFFDFLRGYFDGDGSTYSYWDTRWHSSYMFYMQFASASEVYIHWLENTIFSLLGIHGSTMQTKNCYQLRYAKKATRLLFNRMFYSDTVPCLPRKLQKIQRAFAVDGQHNNIAQVSELVDDLG